MMKPGRLDHPAFYLAAFIGSSAVVNAVNYPLGITNCGVSSWIQQAPERAISMNQGTTEVMLALGLADRMVGTAYIDDEIWGELATDYESVPVLSGSYPTAKQLVDLNPDFLYASYSSAFATSHVNYTGTIREFVEGVTDEDHIGFLDNCSLTYERSNGSNRTTCRQELNDAGMQTYLQTPYCEYVEHIPEELTTDVLFDEIWDIATIFNVLDQGRVLVDSIKQHFEMALEISSYMQQQAGENAEPIKVLWLDSISRDGQPFVGACCGAVQLILEHAGATNVFEDLGLEDRSSWGTVTWEEVGASDPDLIVVVDAVWDSITEKIFNLCNNTLSRDLRAVQNRAFLTVPFSGSTLGVRIGALSYNLAEAFAALTQGRPLPSLEFSETGIETVTQSGVKIYTSSLPEYNNSGTIVNLDEFCPGSPPDLRFADGAAATADEAPTMAADAATAAAESAATNSNGGAWVVTLVSVLAVVVAAL